MGEIIGAVLFFVLAAVGFWLVAQTGWLVGGGLYAIFLILCWAVGRGFLWWIGHPNDIYAAEDRARSRR